MATLAPKSIQKVTKKHEKIKTTVLKMNEKSRLRRECVFGTFFGAPGGQKGDRPISTPDRFGSNLSSIIEKKMASKKASKNGCQKSVENIENYAKMDAKINEKKQCDFGTCDFFEFGVGRTLKSFCYMIRGTTNQPKCIKFNAKSMLEKGMQELWNMMPKWSQNGEAKFMQH